MALLSDLPLGTFEQPKATANPSIRLEGGLKLQGITKINDSDEPLVSIITAVYNGKRFLEQTIRSVLAQDYPNIEYLIIDGGSTDGTLDIIRQYQNQLTYWISEPDNGIYDAWNKGLSIAAGEWLAFVGSDDLLLPDAITGYISYIHSQNGISLDYISSRVELVTADLRLKRSWGSAWKWHTFKKYMNVAHVGSFHHRTFYEKYGLYNTKYRVAADYEILLRAGNQLKAGYFKKITAKMRIGGASLSQINVLQETLEAKVATARRSWFSCYFEFIVARLKFESRRMLDNFSFRI